MFCPEWVKKGVCDTALLNPTKIQLLILELIFQKKKNRAPSQTHVKVIESAAKSRSKFHTLSIKKEEGGYQVCCQ